MMVVFYILVYEKRLSDWNAFESPRKKFPKMFYIIKNCRAASKFLWSLIFLVIGKAFKLLNIKDGQRRWKKKMEK